MLHRTMAAVRPNCLGQRPSIVAIVPATVPAMIFRGRLRRPNEHDPSRHGASRRDCCDPLEVSRAMPTLTAAIAAIRHAASSRIGMPATAAAESRILHEGKSVPCVRCGSHCRRRTSGSSKAGNRRRSGHDEISDWVFLNPRLSCCPVYAAQIERAMNEVP
jgi:hypothetical protein